MSPRLQRAAWRADWWDGSRWSFRFCIDLEAEATTVRRIAADRKNEPGRSPMMRCVRLALADRRVGQLWSKAIRSRRPAKELRMRGLAGPHIPRLVCRQGPPDFESGLAT